MADECTEQKFLNDVKNHSLEILRDDGVYRHLKFSRPDVSFFWFEIKTWPNRLAICGDMGDMTFSRLHDMFQFFRSWDENELKINPSYWSEKVTSESKFGGGVKQFSMEKFKEIIKEGLEEYIEDNDDLTEEEIEDLREECDFGELTEESAHEAASDVRCRGEEVFRDFWEHDLRDYTYHYIWLCYAIVWGIKQYDKVKEAK